MPEVLKIWKLSIKISAQLSLSGGLIFREIILIIIYKILSSLCRSLLYLNNKSHPTQAELSLFTYKKTVGVWLKSKSADISKHI